ncbi:MAG: PH domain-containing protein [Planctomycetota bacterium]
MDDAAIRAIERPHGNLMKMYALQALATTILFPIVIWPLYFKYKTLKYRFDDEGVSASWGILFRREIYLTYKRIQDIHVKRNLFERWLGIGSVEVQTASGSSGAELSLEGMGDYEAVRDFLYRRMRGHEGNAAAKPQAAASVSAAGDEAEVVELLRAIRAELDATRKAIEERAQ